MKMICFIKKMKLERDYDKLALNIKSVSNKIDLFEAKYNYADRSMQEYYSYELIILKEQYTRLMKAIKNVDKEISEV